MPTIQPNGMNQQDIYSLLEDVIAMCNQLKAISPGVHTAAGAALGLGADPADCGCGAFDYYLDGKSYSSAANTAITLPGSNTVTANKVQTYRFSIAKNGTISCNRAATGAGYDNATLALAALPAPLTGCADMGYLTLTHTSNFVEGTTHLNASGATATFVSVTPYVTQANLTFSV